MCGPSGVEFRRLRWKPVSGEKSEYLIKGQPVKTFSRTKAHSNDTHVSQGHRGSFNICFQRLVYLQEEIFQHEVPRPRAVFTDSVWICVHSGKTLFISYLFYCSYS